MHHLTHTQKRILVLLPATPDELADALYGRATQSERNAVYAHIALLRRRLNGKARIISRRWSPSWCSLSPEGEQSCPESATPRARRGACRGDEGRSGREGYLCRIIYELESRPERRPEPVEDPNTGASFQK